MCATFSEDDVGKLVEDANGESVGVVAAVEDDTIRIETDPGLFDTMKAALGWETDAEGTASIDESDVAEITDNGIRLAADRSSGGGSGGHDSVIEREEGAGRRDVGPETGSGQVSGEDDEAIAGEGGADRHADNEDAPPHGDRTVTEERGEGQDR